jgi:hypothetical protein
MQHHQPRLWPCLVLLMLAGCIYWEPYPRPAPQQRLPSSLRVLQPSGEKLLLIEPYVRSDTLYGRTGADTLRIPLHQIRGLERPFVDGLRTTGLILGTTAALVTLSLYTGGLE